MGLIKQGILGGFRKKTGSVVGSYWRKQDVIRALPRSSGKPPTQQQIEHKQKFAAVTSFLSKASGLIDAGYRSGDTQTPMNKAVAYHLKEAITGAWPNFAVDMQKFKYSIGSLELPFSVGVAMLPDAKARFEWDRTTDNDKFISPTDAVTVVAYNTDKNVFVKQVAATTRSIGYYELELPEVFMSDNLHFYISFSSTLKKLNSESKYLGAFILPEPS